PRPRPPRPAMLRRLRRLQTAKGPLPVLRGGPFVSLARQSLYSASLLHLTGGKAAGAHPHTLARTVLRHDTGGLQVRKPTPTTLVVGVADIVPGPRPLAAHGANCGHINLLARARLKSSRIIYADSLQRSSGGAPMEHSRALTLV